MMGIDPSAYIAPTARVHPYSNIGPHCHVGEFCVIESEVELGMGCMLDPYVCIRRFSTLGSYNELSSGVVLGADPLDKNFTGERSYLRIGNNNKIREHFTISRGTEPESETRLGNGNYIMTAGHIAHNCTLWNDIVVASGALVAGYVEIESQAFLSGGVVVHQYSRIGRLAMVGGNTRVNSDLPPYFLYSDFNVAARGLNIVGLRRAGFSPPEKSALRRAFQLLYRSGLPRKEALAAILRDVPTDHTRHLVTFIEHSKRGICGSAHRVKISAPADD